MSAELSQKEPRSNPSHEKASPAVPTSRNVAPNRQPSEPSTEGLAPDRGCDVAETVRSASKEQLREGGEGRQKVGGLVYKGQRREGLRPRYIKGVATSSSRREIEHEVMKERQLKRQRQGGGDSGEEVFVTRAYSKRLQERAAFEKAQAEKELKEALENPAKKKDLTAFHRYLLEKNLSSRSLGSS